MHALISVKEVLGQTSRTRTRPPNPTILNSFSLCLLGLLSLLGPLGKHGLPG